MRYVRLAAFVTAVAIASLPSAAFQRSAKPPQDRKPQSDIAAKSAFGTIPASSPELKKSLDSHDLAGAKKLIGKDGAFHGMVSKVFAPKSNALIILNFDPEFKKALVAVVKAEDFAKFPKLDALKDKHVLVRGRFIDYNGTPELALTNANQVKLVK